MKRKDLEALGLEKEAIDKIMALNGDDINNAKSEVTELEKQLTEKDNSIKELNDTIKGFDGTESTIKDLQSKVADYEQAEKDRIAAMENEKADKILMDNISTVIGEREFVNEYTKQSLINQVKAELAKAENKGIGADSIFDKLTKDVDGIFKNPQQEPINLPPAGTTKEEKVTSLRGALADYYKKG